MSSLTRKINQKPAVAVLRRGPSLTEQIYVQLRESIITAEWEQGSIVLEPELAEAYGVSKTPVREALRLLVQEGWIVILPRKGYMVRPLQLDDISEVFGLRMMIEPALFAEVAAAHSEKAIGTLADRLEDQRNGDLEESLAAARAFHLAAAQVSNHRRAETILGGLLAEVRRLHHFVPEASPHITSDVELEAHAAIYEAIVAGDSAKTTDLVREHISEVANAMVEAFIRR